MKHSPLICTYKEKKNDSVSHFLISLIIKIFTIIKHCLVWRKPTQGNRMCVNLTIFDITIPRDICLSDELLKKKLPLSDTFFLRISHSFHSFSKFEKFKLIFDRSGDQYASKQRCFEHRSIVS